MRCKRRWYYKWVKCIEPIGIRKTALDKGSAIHSLLDFYYRSKVEKQSQGLHPVIVANNCIRKFRNESKKYGLCAEDQQFIIERFLAYVSIWSSQSDWTPLVINDKPQVELGFSIPILDTPEYYFVLEGRIDMITSSGIFVDHKSQSRKYDHYKFSPQFLSYSLASNISQGCVNYISVAQVINEDTFRRKPFSISFEQRNRWKEKLIKICKEMLEATENNYFETTEASCQDQYGLCEYASIDELTDSYMQEKIINIQYQQTEKWTPWQISETKLPNEIHLHSQQTEN
jgi:hypothetical protein